MWEWITGGIIEQQGGTWISSSMTPNLAWETFAKVLTGTKLKMPALSLIVDNITVLQEVSVQERVPRDALHGYRRSKIGFCEFSKALRVQGIQSYLA